MNDLEVCRLGHQGVRGEGDDVVTNPRQGFTLQRKANQSNPAIKLDLQVSSYSKN